MISYKIYQIKDIENTFYAFRSYDPKKFKFEDYELRYEGEFEFIDKKTNLELCEVVFHIFNMQRPEDFKGHSLSMSDLIMIERDGRQSLYYCDMIGFVRIGG